MYPTLPFGPLSLPTGPVLAILAAIVGLELSGRFGKRLGLHPDDVWNTGLIALAAALIVARLWNVFQFWSVYRSEPILILSIRPSGFEFWPGVIAALVGGYVYLIRRALDPLCVGAALTIGALASGVILSISGFMTGAVLGTLSTAPWALPYFGELRHPVGLYQALGLLALFFAFWFVGDARHPGRMILLAAFGYSLLRLFTDGFKDEARMIGPFRASQAAALAAALILSLILARLEIDDRQSPDTQTTKTPESELNK